MLEREPDRVIGLTDDAGLLLTISNLDDVSDVVYPKSFHIGFKRASDATVDNTYERLKADGFSVGEHHNSHSAWPFYLTAPGGFTVEVMRQNNDVK